MRADFRFERIGSNSICVVIIVCVLQWMVGLGIAEEIGVRITDISHVVTVQGGKPQRIRSVVVGNRFKDSMDEAVY